MAVQYLIDIDPSTGEYISGWPRIQKSIETILTTQLGERLMRLGWGSAFLDMQDKPLNSEVMTAGIYQAVFYINKYEPEFRVTNVQISGQGSAGNVQVDVYGIDLIDQQNRAISLLI